MDNKKTKKKRKFSYKKFLFFIIFQILFTLITFPLQVFYGPYEKVRNVMVGTSMATYSHQYIAKTFLSDKRIKEILAEEAKETMKNNSVKDTNTNISSSEVVINSKNDDIELKEIKGRKFHGKALIISNPSKVKVGYSAKLGAEGERTSKMAERYKAVAAINGGGFNDISPDGKIGSGVGAIPTGIVMSQGNVVYPTGNVNKNEKQSCIMGITGDGHLVVGGPYSINDLENLNVKEALSFSPTLIVNGNPHISEYSLQGANPRSVIGQKADGSIIFLAIDGRRGLELGATLKDIQDIMIELGAINAMCLDGGASTTMYYNGEVINTPSNALGERSMPTIIYVEP